MWSTGHIFSATCRPFKEDPPPPQLSMRSIMRQWQWRHLRERRKTSSEQSKRGEGMDHLFLPNGRSEKWSTHCPRYRAPHFQAFYGCLSHSVNKSGRQNSGSKESLFIPKRTRPKIGMFHHSNHLNHIPQTIHCRQSFGMFSFFSSYEGRVSCMTFNSEANMNEVQKKLR